MADRKDFPFRHVVAASELDQAFDDLENADHNLSLDWGLFSNGTSVADGGIVEGLTIVDPAPGSMTVTVNAGTAYDSSGRRIRVPAPVAVNLANAGNSGIGVGGALDGATTTPGVGQERWISLFIEFQRALSDPEIDGTGATVFFERDESFRFVAVQSVDQAPPAGVGARPALDANRILLADIRRDAAFIETVQINPSVPGNIDGRRQVWFSRSDAAALAATWTRGGAGFPIRGIRLGDDLRAVFTQLLGYYNDHVRRDASTTDFHFGKNITYETPTLSWANAETFGAAAVFAAVNGAAGANLTGGVQGAISEIVSDLAGIGAVSGADRLGVGPEVGAGRPANAVGVADALVSGAPPGVGGTLTTALVTLLDAVNEAVRLTGDTMTGNLLPSAATPGIDLGAAGQRWDIFCADLNITNIVSDVATGGATHALGNLGGAATTRFDVGANLLNVLGAATLQSTLNVSALTTLAGLSVGGSIFSHLIPDAPDTYDVGNLGTRWRLMAAKQIDLQTLAAAEIPLVFANLVSNTTSAPLAQMTNKFGYEASTIDRTGRFRSYLFANRQEFDYVQTAFTNNSGHTVERTLALYTADDESAAYVGAADGEAKLADLNALRVAYENLRAAYEDLAKWTVAIENDLPRVGAWTLRQVTGTGASVTFPAVNDAFGVVRLHARRTGADGAGLGVSAIASGATVLADGTTAHRRVHFSARVRVVSEVSNTRRIFIGLGSDPSTWDGQVANLPANFIGFFYDSGVAPARWKFLVRTGGAARFDADVGTSDVDTDWTRLEAFVIAANRIDARVINDQTPKTDTLTNQIMAGGNLPTAALEKIIRIDTTQDDTDHDLDCDYFEIFAG